METGQYKKETGHVFRWLLGLVIVLLVGAIYLFRYHGAESGNGVDKTSARFSDPVLAVAAVTATQGDFPVYLTGLGTVTPLRTVTIRSRVDGELTQVAFKEGSSVNEGDLLAKIDARAFQAQLIQAEGQLQRDEALLQNAKADLVRYKTLLGQDSIAAQQAVTQEWLVKQYKGTVEIDRGLVANAKLQISYTNITSPITGRVGIRLVDQGNIVQATDANGLAVITQIQPIAVVFSLPEDSLPILMKHYLPGKIIDIEAYDRSGKSKLATGQLTAVDNQIDTTTGTVKLKGQFANEDNALFSNQFVNIKMHIDTLQAVTVIPAAAIQRGITGAFVYVVNNDQTVSVRPITLGPTEDERVAVLNGLKPDEKIVVDGIEKLKDKMTVKPITLEAGQTSSDGVTSNTGSAHHSEKSAKRLHSQ